MSRNKLVRKILGTNKRKWTKGQSSVCLAGQAPLFSEQTQGVASKIAAVGPKLQFGI